MRSGEIVLVSDFDGDIETIGVKAIFVGMTDKGKFLTRPLPPHKYKKEFTEWRYCEPLPKS